ncbi:hypothetical protein MYX78_10965 [Acidobacteria bacterium AH-259-G07]|nr:hypothetical protein [Acidobacteria bacterium AH-259-G07]
MAKVVEIHLTDNETIYRFNDKEPPPADDLLKVLSEKPGYCYLELPVKKGRKHIIPKHAILRVVTEDD